MTKASAAALERQNPDLASALKKLERAGAGRDPLQAQRALSRLTPDERQAYLAAIGEQELAAAGDEPRRAAPARADAAAGAAQGSGGGGKKRR